MNDNFVLNTTVSYWDVDRGQKLTLAGMFRFLQEAAIRHADQFDTGAHARETQGKSWVLSRIAACIHRYPHYGDALRIETWSAGIRSCRGYREFRVYGGHDLVLTASSLWLYVDWQSKSLARVPLELAARFPERKEDIFRADLDQLRCPPPTAGAASAEFGLRYSDIDGNAHVNNTAYFELLQTALVRGGHGSRPRLIEVHFQREIPPETESVRVDLERRDGNGTAFALAGPAGLFAAGLVYD